MSSRLSPTGARELINVDAKDVAQYSPLAFSLPHLTAYSISWLALWEIPTTYENISVLNARLFPTEFALSGFPEFPDAMRTNRTLLQMRPKYRGFATSDPRRGVFLTEKGKDDSTPLWPPKDGDLFPFRIKISAPTYVGEISTDEFVPHISFMRDKEAWGGTIQGASGVFNDRLTDEDVSFIKSKLRKISVVAQPAARAAEEPKIKSLFRLIDSDVVESLKRILPSFGLRRFNGENFPAEYNAGYGGTVILCRDVKDNDLVVVDFNRGDAPTDTLIRILRYMSWVRQNLAGKNDVHGIILTESANAALSDIVNEVPNVDLRFYRIGIELLDDDARKSA